MCVSVLRAFAPGIYPRSAELVAATRDLDRGRTTAAAVAERVERDRLALVAAQQEAGFELIVDGMLDWQDLFRPLAERCEGVEARPLTRFLDTNTFFRALLVSGSPRLREPMPVPVLPGDWLGTLPSPYALARAAGGAVAAEVWAANVLAPQVEAWASAGAQLIVLDEPFLAREPDGLDELAAGLAVLPAACPLVLRLPFGDAGPLLPRLLELPLFGIGVDFHATALEALPCPFPAFLYAGVVDVRSSVVEDAISVARFVAELGSFEPHGIGLGPNGDFQFVAEPIARRKLEQLGQAQRALAQAA